MRSVDFLVNLFLPSRSCMNYTAWIYLHQDKARSNMAWIHETPYAYSHNTQSISPIDATQSGLVELSTNNEQPRCTDGSHLASVHLSQPTIRISPSESSGHDEPEPKYEDHTHRRQTRHPTIKTEKSLPQRPAYSETSRWSFNSHDRTPIQVPKGWPTEPSRRHTARWVFVLTLLFDIIITIAPVIFIGKLGPSLRWCLQLTNYQSLLYPPEL